MLQSHSQLTNNNSLFQDSFYPLNFHSIKMYGMGCVLYVVRFFLSSSLC